MVIITSKEIPPFHLVKYQCLAALSANLIVFSHGLTIGWCAPAIWFLLTNESPLASGPISLIDSSWIGSVVYLGGIVGSFLFAIISKFFGGKIALSLLALPNLTGWIVVLCAKYPFELIIARVLTGISSGGATFLVPLFIAEIANKNIRGILGSFFMIITGFGILFGLIITSYVPHGVTPYVLMVPGLIYTCTVLMLPETPQHLLMASKPQKAEKSFRFYNFGNQQKGEMSPATRLEFEQLSSAMSSRMEDSKTNKITFQTFLSGSTLKGIFIGVSLCALALFSGIFCITMYSISIFAETGTHIDPSISAIIIMSFQFVGSFVALIFVDYWGRKFLLATSSFGSAVSLFGFATFAYFHKSNYVLTSYYWVPVTTMALFQFCSNAGILPLTFIIIAESFPQRTRHIGSAICSLSFSAFAFINVKLFPILSNYLGLHTLIWIYGGVCTLGFLFAIIVLEETNGKPLYNN